MLQNSHNSAGLISRYEFAAIKLGKDGMKIK
jgi:hypothetical protein